MRCTRDGGSMTRAEMKTLTLVTVAYMLPWQLAHTLMCVQEVLFEVLPSRFFAQCEEVVHPVARRNRVVHAVGAA